MPGRMDRFTALFTQRKGLKVLALILATVTWIFIRETTSFEDFVEDIPVEIILPEGWAIQDRSVNTVGVGFRGSEADIRALDTDQVTIKADARKHEIEPNMIIRLDRTDVSSPRSVRAMYVDPPEIVLTLDRETYKEVPVRVDLLGQPPDGYDVEGTNITPAFITVHGPERRLAKVEHVRTVPIDMEGRIRSFQINRDLITPGQNWQARMDVNQVRVEFAIVERLTRRDFSDIAVSVMLPPGDMPEVTFSPSTVNVSLKGRSDVISNLTASAIHAFINCTDMEPGTERELPVEVPTRSGFSIIAVEPSTIKVSMAELPK